MLYFSTGDNATDHNLWRLSRLASLDRFDGDADHMHMWLIAAISSIKMLPKIAARHFTGYYFLGDSHFRMSPEHRATTWQQLVEELREHVHAAHMDSTLKRDGLAGPPSVSDRPETRGERILVLCEQLDKASWGTSEFERILSQLGAIAVGEIRADVAELKRLSGRKRISDLADHQYWITRCIQHIRITASSLHYLE